MTAQSHPEYLVRISSTTEDLVPWNFFKHLSEHSLGDEQERSQAPFFFFHHRRNASEVEILKVFLSLSNKILIKGQQSSATTENRVSKALLQKHWIVSLNHFKANIKSTHH